MDKKNRTTQEEETVRSVASIKDAFQEMMGKDRTPGTTWYTDQQYLQPNEVEAACRSVENKEFTSIFEVDGKYFELTCVPGKMKKKAVVVERGHS